MYGVFDKIITKFNRGKAKPPIEKLMTEHINGHSDIQSKHSIDELQTVDPIE
jgi:hypothetical protein